VVTASAATDEIDRTSDARWARVKRWWPLLVVGGLLWFPLIAACVYLSQQRFAPIFDMALFEMRVRDVGTTNTPLVGLGGRLSRWPEIGSHPGPLAFYLFSPIYWLLGGTYWSLRVANATFTAVVIAVALLIARRRLGTLGVVAAGVVLALLEQGLGLLVLTEPWNPYVPVMAFAAFLFAIWSVIAGDVKCLPVAAAIAAVCAQTHISFLAACGGLGALAFAVVAARWLHAKRKGLPRRDLAFACLSAAAVTLVLWSPPIIDELMRERGNFTIVWDHINNPPEKLVGWRGGAEVVLQRLDLAFLLTRCFEKPGILHMTMTHEASATHGAPVLLIWLLCAGLTFKLKDRSLLALHATVAAALAVAVFSASRIIGFQYLYVVFFAWIIGGLVWFSILVTIARALQRRAGRSVLLRGAATGFALLLTVACVVRLTSSVEEAAPRDSVNSRQLAQLAPAAAAAIRARGGQNEHYLVTWEDVIYGGGQGVGLVVEMERYGLSVSVTENYAPIIGMHRYKPGKASARIHFANWGWVMERRKQPGAVPLAYVDPRTPAQRAEFDGLYASLTTALRKAGRPDLADYTTRDLGATNIPQVSVWERLAVSRLAEIGMPAAVFLLPP
jgi:hypothetical protein